MLSSLKSIGGIMIFLMVFSGLAFAIPVPPNGFFGAVTINGNPAPDGTTISAKINGVQVASTTSLGGKYGYGQGFYVPDTDPATRAGSTIKFYVNDVDSGSTAIFKNGDVTLDNLAITVATPPAPNNNGGNNGGGGGGGGGGGVTTTTTTTTTTSNVTQTNTTQTTTTQPAACIEKWSCSDWSSCSNGLQTRTCQDSNNCGTTLGKPIESQPCSTVTPEAQKQGASNSNANAPPLTAFVTENPSLVGGILFIIILIVIYFIWRHMKGNKIKKGKK